MFVYQKFLIRETDRFDPAGFPQLDESLQQTLAYLAMAPAGPSTAMIISFARGHAIHSQHAKDHPQLAKQIYSRQLPITVLEQLFTSSRQNPLFQKDLEDYIVAYLTTEKMRQRYL